MKRPSTPMGSERHMFYGNDHRPESRPSSRGENFRPTADSFLNGTASTRQDLLRVARRARAAAGANVPRPPASNAAASTSASSWGRTSKEIRDAAAKSHRRRK